jgi:threonine aldolase
MPTTPPAIDLRSDTVTLPTPAMRAAMASAEVGDDVYAEDPTVNRLEALAAARLGKEAALFVASGTMANAAAILTHCRRGDALVVGDRAHIWEAEVGGAARLNGSMALPVPNRPDGTFDPARVEALFAASEDIHAPRIGLLCLEDTHNMCGGRVIDAAHLREMAAPARRRGVPVHLDGARLFNAAVALGVPARALAAEADSVMFCLSKGLSAPVGSLLCGDRAFIADARRVRKVLGGGMRQAGILAAAGILGLEEMVDRLAEDHANARRLAARLAAVPGLDLRPDEVESNFVFFHVREADGPKAVSNGERPGDDPVPAAPAAFIRAAAAAGVLVSEGDDGRVRAATHSGVTADDIERAANVLARIAERHSAPLPTS